MLACLKSIRRTGNASPAQSSLHRDHLSSVRAISGGTGILARITACKPFGPATDTNSGPSVPPESKGFNGEHYDATTGLLYLNARFYDPSLGRFIQPDRWEVL